MSSDETTQEFKVVDKRRFDEDGKKNESTSENVAKESPKSQEPKKEPVKEEAYQNAVELNFSSFIMSLATQTMMLLGEIPHPETNLTTVNIEAARQTIDILAILEEKTKGNLNDAEDKLVQEILASLRIAYVNKVNSNPK